MSSVFYDPLGRLDEMLQQIISAWRCVSKKLPWRATANQVISLNDMRCVKAAALCHVLNNDTDKLRPAIQHLQELLKVELEKEEETLCYISKQLYFKDMLEPLQAIVLHYTNSELYNDFEVLNHLCHLKDSVEKLTSLWLKMIEETVNFTIESWFNTDVMVDDHLFSLNPPVYEDVVCFSRPREEITTARSSIFKAIDDTIGKVEVDRYKREKPPMLLYPRIAKAGLRELNPLNLTECCICLAAISIKEDNIAVLEKCPHIFCAPCIREWINNKSSCPVCRESCRSAISRDDFLTFKIHRFRFSGRQIPYLLNCDPIYTSEFSP